MDKYYVRPFNINGQASYTLLISTKKIKKDREIYKASDVAEFAKRMLYWIDKDLCSDTEEEYNNKCDCGYAEYRAELEALAEGKDG